MPLSKILLGAIAVSVIGISGTYITKEFIIPKMKTSKPNKKVVESTNSTPGSNQTIEDPEKASQVSG